MAEQRRQPRVAVHYRVVVHRPRGEGRGKTENISERGAMIYVEAKPPLEAGELVTLEIHLPSAILTMPGRIQWTSTVLPGMVGAAFDPPVAPEYVAHYAELYNRIVGQAS